MRHDVRQSKHNCCKVGGTKCSGYTPWNTEIYDISVIQLGKTWAFCRCITRGHNCFWHWMIRVRHIFMSHPPHARPGASYDLTLAALGKNVKKQQEVSDLNQDYVVFWFICFPPAHDLYDMWATPGLWWVNILIVWKNFLNQISG